MGSTSMSVDGFPTMLIWLVMVAQCRRSPELPLVVLEGLAPRHVFMSVAH
jgi:hypothetical protein